MTHGLSRSPWKPSGLSSALIIQREFLFSVSSLMFDHRVSLMLFCSLGRSIFVDFYGLISHSQIYLFVRSCGASSAV